MLQFCLSVCKKRMFCEMFVCFVKYFHTESKGFVANSSMYFQCANGNGSPFILHVPYISQLLGWLVPRRGDDSEFPATNSKGKCSGNSFVLNVLCTFITSDFSFYYCIIFLPNSLCSNLRQARFFFPWLSLSFAGLFVCKLCKYASIQSAIAQSYPVALQNLRSCRPDFVHAV